MFQVNYLTEIAGVDFAYVNHGFTAQAEATLQQSVRLRGSHSADATDLFRTNAAVGLPGNSRRPGSKLPEMRTAAAVAVSVLALGSCGGAGQTCPLLCPQPRSAPPSSCVPRPIWR